MSFKKTANAEFLTKFARMKTYESKITCCTGGSSPLLSIITQIELKFNRAEGVGLRGSFGNLEPKGWTFSQNDEFELTSEINGRNCTLTSNGEVTQLDSLSDVFKELALLNFLKPFFIWLMPETFSGSYSMSRTQEFFCGDCHPSVPIPDNKISADDPMLKAELEGGKEWVGSKIVGMQTDEVLDVFVVDKNNDVRQIHRSLKNRVCQSRIVVDDITYS